MANYSIFFKPTDVGLSPQFVKFIDQVNFTDYSPGPTIYEVVGPMGSFGEYRFDYNVTPGQPISFVIDGGSGLPAGDRYQRGVITADDSVDQTQQADQIQNTFNEVQDIRQDTRRIKVLKEGRWKIFNSGIYANQLVQYDTDNATPLQIWDLKDIVGNPTVTSITERIPTIDIP